MEISLLIFGLPKNSIMLNISVNSKQYPVDTSPSTPLLWVIRDIIGLTGTKFGCGILINAFKKPYILLHPIKKLL